MWRLKSERLVNFSKSHSSRDGAELQCRIGLPDKYCIVYTLKILFIALAELTRHFVFLFAKSCNPNPGEFGLKGCFL